MQSSCVDYSVCFSLYDEPLLYGMAGGVSLALFMAILAYFITPRPKKVQKKPPPVIAPVRIPTPVVEVVQEEEHHDDLNGPIYYEGEDHTPVDEPMPLIENA